MVGYVGVLTVACRGSAGPGEVQLSIRGGSERFLAVSDDPMPIGTRVLVIESRGHRTVTVVPWDDTTDLLPPV
jgi:hypothetical protein